MNGDVSLSGAALVAVSGLLSALSLAIIALFRHLLAAKDAHIVTLSRELLISQQREEAWRAAAFDTLPILQKQSEVAADAFTLARKRGLYCRFM